MTRSVGQKVWSDSLSYLCAVYPDWITLRKKGEKGEMVADVKDSPGLRRMWSTVAAHKMVVYNNLFGRTA